MDEFKAKMNQRPKATDTEDDLLAIQAEYLRKKNENPDLKPCVQIIKIKKPHAKSIFAASRESNRQNANAVQPNQKVDERNEGNANDSAPNVHAHSSSISSIVLGDIIEKTVDKPKHLPFVEEAHENLAFPKMKKSNLPNLHTHHSKSLFSEMIQSIDKQETFQPDDLPISKPSVEQNDIVIAREVHEEYLLRLKQMKLEEILQEKTKLLNSLDPNTIKFLTKNYKERYGNVQQSADISTASKVVADVQQDGRQETVEKQPPKIAANILERSLAEQWINFNVVENDKLEWMHDVSFNKTKLSPNQEFEARFDWKGALLPYITDAVNPNEFKDDRDLYLHGEEPHRPGYTLQELFRLARSSIVKQRLAGYNAIDGILNFYQQGFYDQMFELPISRIFFLLRVGMDCNTPSILDAVCKALATLLYNESDEQLLDLCFENPNCHWQMDLQVVCPQSEATKATTSSREAGFSEQLKDLHLDQLRKANHAIENDEESESSMLDIELAEKDLIHCVLRTNILQRIYYILAYVKPENSAVLSCLKILIRLSRTSPDVAKEIADDNELMECLFRNFLPQLQKIDLQPEHPVFYSYPQYLCLKLLRVLISSNLNIAIKLNKYRLCELIEGYLATRSDFKVDLIKVQIECLRIMRCLFLLNTDNKLQVSLLPVFTMMLHWHNNHMVYESRGPYLLRQHAAAVIMAIASLGKATAVQALHLLGGVLSDCCCNWFNKAKLAGVKEFSQSTLLSSCVTVMVWCIQHNHCDRVQHFINKYLIDFVKSQSFAVFYSFLFTSAAVINEEGIDRRNVLNALPNFGSIVMHSKGPQMIISPNYPFHLLHSLWQLMELTIAKGHQCLHDALLQGNLKPQLIKYLSALPGKCNQHLATNFYVRTEIQFICQLLRSDDIENALSAVDMQLIVYNFLNCLTAEFSNEMEKLFMQVIFNTKYMNDVEPNELNRWYEIYTQFIYHNLKDIPNESSLTLHEGNRQRLLPPDWPYFQFRQILQNSLNSVQNFPLQKFSEREAVMMTLNMVEQLEKPGNKLEICSPTESLMYLMIAFMGSESKFLDKEVHHLLQTHIQRFISKHENTKFEFERLYPCKCRFENLYKMFVDHFQAASYADELFSALVMIPLAQKYDKKWRLLVWSEYCYVLPYLTCKENLLIGGLAAYLQPPEKELDLIRLYDEAMRGILSSRSDTVPYKIAAYHTKMFWKSQLP